MTKKRPKQIRLFSATQTGLTAPLKRHNITIDDHSLAVARTLGNGNISAGIRVAIAAAAVGANDLSTRSTKK